MTEQFNTIAQTLFASFWLANEKGIKYLSVGPILWGQK